MIRIPGVRFQSKVMLLLLLLGLGLGVARYLQVSRPARAASGLQPQSQLLVSPERLNEHVDKSNVRIVDLRGREQYAEQHVPGAVWMDPSALSRTVNGIHGMAPDPAAMAAVLGAAGIGNDTVVVAYDQSGGLLAARLFWILDWLGDANGRVLDGGWPAWSQAGLPTTKAVPTIEPATFKATPHPEKMADLAYVREHLGDPGVALVDARSPGEYEGSVVYAKHGGHIPGAASYEWKRHLRPDGRMRDAVAILAEYEALGVTPDKQIITYCQSHTRAAHNYFTLRWLGFPDVRGYDGSWGEWGNRDDTPIETGKPQARAEPAPAGPAAAATSEAVTLRPGLTAEEARGLLGEPNRVEAQNPCWGEQAVWHYAAGRAGTQALTLRFVDGRLAEVLR